MSDSRADRAKALYSNYKKRLEEKETELADALERNRPRVERYHQADSMLEAYNRSLAEREKSMLTTPELLAENIEKAKKARDDYKSSDESVGFFEMVFGSPSYNDWKESRTKRNQLNDAVDDAQGVLDAYNTAHRNRYAQSLDIDELDKHIAKLEEEKAEKEPSTFEKIMAFLGKDPKVSYKVNEKSVEEQAPIGAEIARYRTVRDTKKSQEMLKDLPDDVISLLDEYNNAKAGSESNNMQNIFVSTNGGYIYDESSDRKNEIAQKLKQKGYDNYEELSTYRSYLKNAEDAEKQAKETEKFASEHPVLSSVASVAVLPYATVTSAIGNFEQFKDNSDLGYDVNSPYNMMTNYKNQTRDTVASNIESGILSRNFKRHLYQDVMSGADSMLASTMPGSDILLGMSAMNDAVADIAQKGGTKSQALLGGLAAGTFETLFEHASIGQFRAFKEMPVKNIKTALMNIGKGMVTNFSEEAATEIANIIYDYLANDGISDYYQLTQQYIDSGMNESEARRKASISMGKRIADAGLGGALMGGVFGAAGSAMGKFNYDSQMQQIGRGIAENEGVEKLLAGSSDVNADSDSAFSKLLNKVTATEDARAKAAESAEQQASSEPNSDTESKQTVKPFEYKHRDYRNVGKLSQALNEKTDSESVEIAKNAVKERLNNLGESSDNIDRLSKSVVKAIQNDKLSYADRNNISKSKYAQQVVTEYFSDRSSDSSAWADSADEKVSNLFTRRYSPDIEAYRNRKQTSAEQNTEVESGISTDAVAEPNTIQEIAEANRGKYTDYAVDLMKSLYADNKADSPSSFEKVFDQFYMYGKSGDDFEKIKNANVDIYFDEKSKKEAYDAGVRAAEIGKRTQLREISKITTDDVIVKDNAGNEVSLSEVNAPVQTMQLYKAAATYQDTDTANAFIKGYNIGVPFTSYDTAFKTFYAAGEGHPNTNAQDFINSGEYDSMLKFISKNTAAIAFNQGVKYVTADKSNNEKVKPESGEQKAKGEYKNFTGDSSAMDEVYNAVAKKLGIDIQKVQSVRAKNDVEANARFIPHLFKIEISSSAFSEFTDFVHELGHVGEAVNQKEMQKVRDSLIDWYTDQSGERGREELIESVMRQYGNISHEAATEEVISEALAKLFSEDEGIDDFISWLRDESGYNEAERKTIIQRITDMLKSIIDTIKQVIANGELSYVAEEFAGMQADKAHEIRQQFLKVLDGAGENYKNQTQSSENSTIKDSRKLTGNADGVYNGNVNGKRNTSRKSTYSEFNTLAMQWAYSADTHVGDIKSFYDPYAKEFVMVEATQIGEGFERIEHINSRDRRSSYNELSSHKRKLSDSFAETRTNDDNGRFGNDSSFSENRAENERDDRLRREQSESDREGDLERSRNDSEEIPKDVKYSLKPTNSSGLSTDNRAKTPYDSVNKWVYDAEIFSYEENKLFHQKISEINQGSQAFEKNAKGEYMLPIENKIVFTDGDYNSPYITRIIEVMSDYATDFEDIRSVIYDAERGISGIRESARAVENIAGKESVYEYTSNVNGTYEWVTGKRKRGNRKSIIKNSRAIQNRRRNASSSDQIVRRESRDTIHDGEKSVKYSLNMTEEILTRENEELRKLLEEQKRQFFNNGYTTFLDGKEIAHINKSLRDTYGSSIDRAWLQNELQDFYKYLANRKKNTARTLEAIRVRSKNIAIRILEKSQYMKNEISREHLDILKDIKSVRIKLSNEQKREVAGQYGSYGEYRKKSIGTVICSDSGVDLDSRWQELCDMYPQWFNKDISEPDQPLALINIAQQLRKKYDDPDEFSFDEAVEFLSVDIFNRFFDVSESQNTIQKIKNEQKALYDKKLAQSVDTNERAKSRKFIRKKANNFMTLLLNPTNTKNIPEEFQKSVLEICKILSDDTGVFDYRQLDKIKKGYATLKQTAFASSIDEDLKEGIEKLKETISGKRLAELSLNELSIVRDILDNVNAIIRNSQEIFIDGKKASYEAKGKQFMKEAMLAKGKKKRYLAKPFDDVRKFNEKILTSNLKPVYFFKRIGGIANELHWDLIKSQGTYTRTMEKAHGTIQSNMKKYNHSAWSGDKKTYTINTTAGEKLDFTVQQMLSLYTTQLREQKSGKDSKHLLSGGIVFENEIVKEKNGKKYIETDYEAHQISYADILKISSLLTQEQKDYAEAQVHFLSTDIAELGNEVSMQLYGIRKFKESFYFPFNSAKSFLNHGFGDKGETLLRNAGFTKNTQYGAATPLVLSDFDQIVGDHIDLMARYNAFVIPIENLVRVWNYKTPTTETEKNRSAISEFTSAYGKEYTKYMSDYLSDINGKVMKDSREDVTNKWTRKMKKAAVFMSASVAIQQPSAFVRMMTYVDPKYFAIGAKAKNKNSYEELKKYAPVALLKEIGGYDVNSGRTMTNWLFEEKPKAYKDKVKEFLSIKDSSYRDEKFSYLAGKADEITWTYAWEALKAETRAKTGLSGEALLEKAGERFTEVIEYTQVYDSVFTRSSLMRSKSSFLQMATAFMAEPTVTVNMLADAIHSRDKAFFARTLGSVVGATLLNAALKSIITAARNDDDDKNPFEKYIAEIVVNFLNDMNPISLIPFYKDVLSIFQGYNVDRIDMTLFGNFVDAIKTMCDSEASFKDKLIDFSGAIGSFTGIPAKNILRDLNGFGNTIRGFKNGSNFSASGTKFAIKDNHISPILENLGLVTPPKKGEVLFDAWLSGDAEIYNRMAKEYKSGKSVKTALSNQIKEHFKSGEFDESDALELLKRLDYDNKAATSRIDDWLNPDEEDEEDEKYAKFKRFETLN